MPGCLANRTLLSWKCPSLMSLWLQKPYCSTVRPIYKGPFTHWFTSPCICYSGRATADQYQNICSIINQGSLDVSVLRFPASCHSLLSSIHLFITFLLDLCSIQPTQFSRYICLQYHSVQFLCVHAVAIFD